MSRNKFPKIIITVFLAIIAIFFILMAVIPYPSFKSLLGSFVSDGNFKSLNGSNAIIFRGYFLAIGLFLIFCSFILAGGYLKKVSGLLIQYFLDFKTYLKSLKPTKFDKFALLIMLLALGSAVILRLVRIFDQLIHDEGYTYVVFSSTSLFNTITNYHLPNNHVFNSVLIYFFTHLLGIQPWVVRLPALLAGLLLIPGTFVLANQVYDKYTALLSAILVAILPGAIRYSTIARGYSLVALFTVLALIMAGYVKRNKNLFAWSLLVLFCSLGFYSNPVMLFSFGIIFVWLFFESLITDPGPYSSKHKFLKYWLVAGLSTAILVLILYTPIFIYSGVDKVFANRFVSPQPWAGYLSSLPNQIPSIWNDWVTGLQSAWATILIIGFVLSLVLHTKISQVRFPQQLAAFIWIFALVLIQRPERAPKAWVYLQALFMIWSAAGIIGILKLIPSKYSRRVPFSAIVVSSVLLVVLVSAIKLVPTIPDRWNEKGPVEKTVIDIKDQISPKDLIIIDTPYDAVTWYYAELYGLPMSYFNKNLPFNDLFVIVDTKDGQSLQSVLESRGPEDNQIDIENSSLIFGNGYLDTYLVPHSVAP
jgi:uncharacterized membrane protein